MRQYTVSPSACEACAHGVFWETVRIVMRPLWAAWRLVVIRRMDGSSASDEFAADWIAD